MAKPASTPIDTFASGTVPVDLDEDDTEASECQTYMREVRHKSNALTRLCRYILHDRH